MVLFANQPQQSEYCCSNDTRAMFCRLVSSRNTIKNEIYFFTLSTGLHYGGCPQHRPRSRHLGYRLLLCLRSEETPAIYPPAEQRRRTYLVRVPRSDGRQELMI